MIAFFCVACRDVRSAEAEMRALLEAAVNAEGHLRLCSALAEHSRRIGLASAEVEALELARDNNPAVKMTSYVDAPDFANGRVDSGRFARQLSILTVLSA